MSENKLSYRLSKSLRGFYNTKGAVVFFSFLTTLFVILQVSLYTSGTVSINGLWISDGSWLPWLAIVVSVSACLFQYGTTLLVFRNNGNFIYFKLASSLLMFVTAVLSGLFFVAVAALYSFSISIIRKWVWSSGYLQKWDISSKSLFVIGASVFTGFLIVFSSLQLFVLTNFSHNWFGSDNAKPV